MKPARPTRTPHFPNLFPPRIPSHVVEQGKALGHGRFLAAEHMGAGPAHSSDQSQTLGLLEQGVEMIVRLGQLGHELGGLALKDDLDLLPLLPHDDGDASDKQDLNDLHEIKNPLSAITIQLALLKKTLPPERGKDLKVMESEVQRLTQLTNKVSDFLKNPLGNPSVVDLNDLFSELFLTFPKAVKFTSSGNEKILMDPDRARSVFENLVKNAIESCQGRDPQVEVEIKDDKRGKIHEAEIGYWIGEPYWGRGLVPEAVHKLLSHCFEDMGCVGVWCGRFEDNIKSQRVQEKCGFVYHHRDRVRFAALGEVRTVVFSYLSKTS